MASTPQARRDLELRDYLAVFRRRWRLMAVIVAVIVGLVMSFTLTRPRKYTTNAWVVLAPNYSQTVLDATRSQVVSGEDQTINEADLMRSAGVQAAIKKRLGYLPDVKVVVIERTDASKTRTIAVYAKDRSPQVAAKASTDFVESFAIVRTNMITSDLEEAMANLRKRMTDLDHDVAASNRRIQEIDAEIAAPKPDTDIAVLNAERERLLGQVEPGAVAGRQQSLQANLDALKVAQSLNREKGAFMVSAAAVPTSPSEPKPKLAFVMSLGLSLLLAMVVAFLRDYFDTSIRTKEDLDLVTGGIPVLGMVPVIEGAKNDSAGLEILNHPYSPATEAYRSIRTALDFAAIEHKINVVQITSSAAGEGKTTTAANLAVSAALADKRVILIDCDLRRPRVHEYFGLDNEFGFTSILLGECAAHDALQPVPGVDNALVLTSGPPPPNPSELLSTTAARDLIHALTVPSDLIVIDSPPLLPVADASVIAGFVDSTILVVNARTVRRREVERSLEIMAQIEAPLEGIVMNLLGSDATYAGGYGYGPTYAYRDH